MSSRTYVTADEPVLSLTRSLMEIESTSGSERAVANFIAGWLEARGWTVQLQSVDGGAGDRANVLAYRNSSSLSDIELLFNTHMDTVPPYIGFSEDAERIYGRGSTDAKSNLAAMLTAVQNMVESGEPDVERIGFLFVVGEEVDHAGMIKANELGLAIKYLVVGEPTESKMGVGHKGGYKFLLEREGRAAHSGYPELGESAIEPLMEVALDLSRADLPTSPVLGKTTLNVGMFNGGVAANVIPEYARAEVMVRVATTVEETASAIDQVRARPHSPRLISRTAPW
mgnify:FL=1